MFLINFTEVIYENIKSKTLIKSCSVAYNRLIYNNQKECNQT